MLKEKLYLIDGSNYIYRAYYAIGPLSTSKGFPTNALYGFTQMMLKFMRDKKPRYMAVVFDTKEPTFRDELFEDYKANRSEPPDDLVEQFPHFKPILKALNIPVLELAGFEADDVIGTIAKKLSSDEMDVVIVTGDKDLMQLVNDGVSIYDSMKDLYIGEKEVLDRFGVVPSKVVDVLGLAGDASDNIPGVPGIGPKTAGKLIAQYGSIENLVDHVNELSLTIADKIKKNADKAALSKKLVTIDTNVPINFSLEGFLLSGPDEGLLRNIFGQFEFLKLLSELAPQSTVDRSCYETISTEDALEKLIAEIKKKKAFSLDLETTSLDVMDTEIVGVSVATEPGRAFYIPIGHAEYAKEGSSLFDCMDKLKGQLPASQVFGVLKEVLADPNIKKIGQNLKFDVAILRHHEIEIKGLFFDTMIASYLLSPDGKHDLDNLAMEYLGHKKITFEEIVSDGKKQKCFSQVPINEARDYSCEDADVTLRLADIFLPRLKEAKLDDLFFDLEMPLLEVLLDMELAGIKVDVDKLKLLSIDFEKKLRELEKKIFDQAGSEFNINSPKQLGVVLFEKLKLVPPKKTKTGYSTDMGVLEDLSKIHPLPLMVIEYRSLSKLKSTYVDALIELVSKKTNRVHTSFNQTVAATGRLSSSEPNLQNIPIRMDEGKKIREAFIADDGFLLISADYSQIELRVLAHLSRDEVLLDAFKNDCDIHKMTAAEIFGVPPEKIDGEKRSVGKTVNFATIYGQGPFGLSSQLGITVDEAKRYIESYFKRYPAVGKYRDEILEKARKEGFVETLLGRRRYVADINSKNMAVKQAAERMAFNAVFQGTAADIIKKAMVEIHRELKAPSPLFPPPQWGRAGEGVMLLQVHDELLFEVPKGDAEAFGQFAKGIMENAVKLDVPLLVEVGIGKNWLEAH